MPGFGLTLGLSVTWLSLIVLIPLMALLIKAAGLGVYGWWQIVSDERVIGAMKLSFGTALLAALVNSIVGTLVAWVLVRYRFYGRAFVDALIDLPFALPTAVAGIALTAIYAGNGWIGQYLEQWGLKIAYAPAGIVIALIFIGLPFTVRTLQPVLENLHIEHEEAAASLGASRFTTLWRVIFPQILPAILTGFSLAFARGVGEYGSVIFIAGNLPYVSEIAPLLIVIKLDEFDYAGATVVATLMLVTSFLILFCINTLQRRLARGQAL
ncbi:MAG: sulfate ABC transporter permease subunit CysT [Arenimonas sp.]